MNPPRSKRDASVGTPGDAGTIVDGDPFESRTNLDESPLAIEGDMLVERVGDQLWQWDLKTMQRVDVFSLPARSFTVLPDRSIVTWGQDAPGDAECRLYRLVGGAVTKYTTLLCVGAGEMLRRTGTSDAIYVVYSDRVVHIRFAEPPATRGRAAGLRRVRSTGRSPLQGAEVSSRCESSRVPSGSRSHRV